MRNPNYLIFALLILFISSCSRNGKGKGEAPVARVSEIYLYPSDMEGIFDPKLSEKDSIDIRKKYIEKWIKKQLLLQKAELNLNFEQKDVSKELDDYRTALLIYKYEEMLLRQQMDTVVDSKEIESYYNKNTNNFILNQPAMKGVYIKLPSKSPYQEKLARWIRSDNPDDLKELDSYCFQYARKYDYFNDQWIYFEPLRKLLPIHTNDIEGFLRNNKYVELHDSAFNYYLNIKEYKVSGNTAPLNLVKEDISRILLNKRKMQLLQNLENDIYNNAYNRDKIEIYK
jgi:hypothetical protein